MTQNMQDVSVKLRIKIIANSNKNNNKKFLNIYCLQFHLSVHISSINTINCYKDTQQQKRTKNLHEKWSNNKMLHNKKLMKSKKKKKF